ncbi:MAG: type III-A CRISPR-associated protein Csm2 [Candidatus Riflebacteria bacterium]|nr:type III-A CRISPR-associated protein Csm2 [Candidatus Riflebacteria bacterium]
MQEFTFWKNKEKKLVTPDLFSDFAEKAAKAVSGQATDKLNKSTQLRRFFDDVLTFGSRLKELPNDRQSVEFEKTLPYLKMLNAKVAYARARELISPEFKDFIGISLRQLNDLEDFRVFHTLFEAFMGYYKFFDKEREDRVKEDRNSRQRGGRF